MYACTYGCVYFLYMYFSQYVKQFIVVQSWQMDQGLGNGMWLKVPFYGSLQSHGFLD